MNTLIKFEDKYGCATLFNKVSPLDVNEYNIQSDLCNTGVFRVTKNEAINNTRIVIVFDLDDDDNLSLTGESLRDRLSKFIITENSIKNVYKNKIILIPVFICYETLYLFSQYVKEVLSNIDTYEDTETVRLIKAFKKYYDYSILNPEHTDGLKHKLQSIRDDIDNITEQPKMKGKFLPQHFHKSYSKQILKLMFRDIVNSYENGDKILDKNVDEFLNQLEATGNKEFIISIVDGLGNKAILNKELYKLLTVQDIAELDSLVLTRESLNNLCKKLDSYNKRLKNFGLTTQTLLANQINRKLHEAGIIEGKNV